MRMRLLLPVCAVLSALLATNIVPVLGAEAPEVSREDTEFFEKNVRPMLVAKCQSCHGAKKQEFGLRLDSKAGLMKGSDGGPVVIPGKPDESSLVEAVKYAGSIQMPPDGKLAATEIASLTEWVRRGAPWPAEAVVESKSIGEAARTHWAFQPIKRPALPAVKLTDWPRTPVDRFILAKLEANGMTASDDADRRTLLRRLKLDLIGLPPTPEEAAEFINDPRPDAYEQLVDRLLASPQYGERWARYWLDVARYADTKGYVFFEDVQYPWAWTYRDYVVNAFNEDLPYDQFLREQLSADLIPNLPSERLAALGFLTAGNRFMNNQHDILDDRIDVLTRGVLGITVGCARCHDHKFDPIPTADYYSLYGIFKNAREPLVFPLRDAPPNTDEYRTYDFELWKRLQQMDEFVNEKFNGIVDGARNRCGEYLMAAYTVRNQPTTENFMLITDKGDLNPAMNVRWQKYLEETQRSKHQVWTVWHLFADAFDPAHAVGAAKAPESPATPQAESERIQRVLARIATETDERLKINPLIRAAFSGQPAPQTMKDVAQRYADVLKRIDREWRELTAYAEAPGVAIEELVPKRLPDDAAEEVRLTLYGADAPANLPRLLGWGFLSLLPDRASQGDFQKLLKEIESWAAKGPGAPPRAMSLVEVANPSNGRVFLRGNPARPGAEVPRWAPGITDPDRKPFTKGSGRDALADVLASPTNPLTARVIVNRLWMHHFGQGLVATAGDFGLRSDPPTHPELLDWLAAELKEGRGSSAPGQGTEMPAEGRARWSLKQIHRQIVLSSVYRQSSSVPPVSSPSTINNQPSTPTDPENRLLGRMTRRRLDLEALRDSLVAVTGKLQPTFGGPAVTILETFLPRRTLYGHINRQDLAPLYRDFDFPDPAGSSPQRETTTVPPQALFLMNNAFSHACATHLIARPDVQSQPTLEAKLDRVSWILFSRPQSAEEKKLALDYLGTTPNSDQWFRYVHALLLTNEFAFVD